MYAPKKKNINRNNMNSNINFPKNNSTCKYNYSRVFPEFDLNIIVYILFAISCLFNLTFITSKKKNRIKNVKECKNILIQTDPEIVSYELLINPDNNIQIIDCNN